MIGRHYTVDSIGNADGQKVYRVTCRYCVRARGGFLTALDASNSGREHLSSAHADKLPRDRLDQL